LPDQQHGVGAWYGGQCLHWDRMRPSEPWARPGHPFQPKPPPSGQPLPTPPHHPTTPTHNNTTNTPTPHPPPPPHPPPHPPQPEEVGCLHWHSHKRTEDYHNNIFPGGNDDDDDGGFPGSLWSMNPTNLTSKLLRTESRGERQMRFNFIKSA